MFKNNISLLTRNNKKNSVVEQKKQNNNSSSNPFILVTDIEATCERSSSDLNIFSYYNEIIEFPVIVIDVKQKQIVAEFHSFVKPTVNPTLTEFCTSLTGIKQEQVDEADSFPVVLQRFREFLISNGLLSPKGKKLKNFCFATDGVYDIAKFIQIEFEKLDKNDHLRLTMAPLFESWIDVRKSFSSAYQSPRTGISNMLSYFRLSFEGNKHSGLDDSRNLARIVLCMLEEDKISLFPNENTKFGEIKNVVKGLLKRDRVTLNITQEIKAINKVLQMDKKNSPFSSHNKFQVYCMKGNISKVKNAVRSSLFISEPQYLQSAGFSNYHHVNMPSTIKCCIQTAKKTLLEINRMCLDLDPYGEYEDNPLQKSNVLQSGNFCSFKKATFVGTFKEIKMAISTLSGGANGTISVIFYCPQGTKICCKSSDSYVQFSDVSMNNFHSTREGNKNSKIEISKFKEFKLISSIPSGFDSESVWRSWRERLYIRRRELQVSKNDRMEKLKDASKSLYSFLKRKVNNNVGNNNNNNNNTNNNGNNNNKDVGKNNNNKNDTPEKNNNKNTAKNNNNTNNKVKNNGSNTPTGVVKKRVENIRARLTAETAKYKNKFFGDRNNRNHRNNRNNRNNRRNHGNNRNFNANNQQKPIIRNVNV